MGEARKGAREAIQSSPHGKISCVKAVQVTPYRVLAGVYDDATVEELQQISGQ